MFVLNGQTQQQYIWLFRPTWFFVFNEIEIEASGSHAHTRIPLAGKHQTWTQRDWLQNFALDIVSEFPKMSNGKP